MGMDAQTTGMTAEAAQRFLMESRRRAQEACREELAEVLKKHAQRLDCAVTVRGDGTIVPQIYLVSAPVDGR